jgi:hypothetical protein
VRGNIKGYANTKRTNTHEKTSPKSMRTSAFTQNVQMLVYGWCAGGDVGCGCGRGVAHVIKMCVGTSRVSPTQNNKNMRNKRFFKTNEDINAHTQNV